jgi:hypothetical protein
LPSPRPTLGFPRPLGSFRPGSLGTLPVPSSSSLVLRRHPSVFALRSLLLPSPPSSTQERIDTSTLLERLDPSASPDTTTLLLTPLREAPRTLSSRSRSPTLRVWLPSRWCQPALPLEASFSSQRSWASPSRAFLHLRDQPKVSLRSLRPRTSYENLVGLRPVPRRLAPT